MRFALAALWLELATNGYRGRAAFGVIAIVAAGSDFIDGRVARILNVSSGKGRWLDGIADVTFVLTAMLSESWMRAIPLYIPILVAISFSQYAIDSIVIARRSTAGETQGPIRSRLGHGGGIINYAIVIALAFAPPPSPIGEIIRATAPLLALFYLAAIAERAWLFYRRD
ncbi:MAG: hypothetical protein JWM69_1291 [Candidatus Binatus sp.]|nr:hypothetical protein [Candidatus Binatus sp.]